MSEEYSFEELRAAYRGWMSRDWAAIRREEQEQSEKESRAAASLEEQLPEATPPPARQEPPETARRREAPMIFRDPIEDVPQPKKQSMVYRDSVNESTGREPEPEPTSSKLAPHTKPVSMVFRDPVDLPLETEKKTAVFRDVAEDAPKPKALSPMVFRDPVEEVQKPQTVPLKGSIDDEATNDENTPPSRADVEKAKAAKKARHEERANRTRKIKVMDVKEIRGETQTSR